MMSGVGEGTSLGVSMDPVAVARNEGLRREVRCELTRDVQR